MTADHGAVLDQGRREYDRPPIVEGLCQLNFASPIDWNPIVPGMFYERIRAGYPEKPEVQQEVRANVQFPNDAAGEAQFNLGQGQQRLIYKNANRDKLIVLTPTSLSANSLPPYEGWPSLSKRLKETLTKTAQVLGSISIASVSVRYINRILIPIEEPTAFAEYFDLPFRGVGLPGQTSSTAVFQRVESKIEAISAEALRTFASVEPIEGETSGTAFLLDIEFRRFFETPATIDAALNASEELKQAENAEFELCVTDRTRELFK